MKFQLDRRSRAWAKLPWWYSIPNGIAGYCWREHYFGFSIFQFHWRSRPRPSAGTVQPP